jgi:phage tail-like protein
MTTRNDPTADPYSAHRFWVEIGGTYEGLFTECSGLTSEVEVEEVKEGGQMGYIHRLPGRVKSFPNLVLKRGLATSELWDWYCKVASGKASFQRQNLTIALKGGNELPLVRWEIMQALPIKWVGPSFKSGGGELAVESVEFIHQGFERK